MDGLRSDVAVVPLNYDFTHMCRYELPADITDDKELKLIPVYMRLDR